MVPSPITEDYYKILEVDQNATLPQIVSAYKRLALKLHPDRNAQPDATEAFQLLGQAYETLRDETRRQEYNQIYPSIARKGAFSKHTQTPRSPTASTPQSNAISEAAQIIELQRAKQVRSAQWTTRKNVFDSSIFELQRTIRQLVQEIKILDSISAAEAAEEAQKNSWMTWLLSPIYKQAEDDEQEKARKDRKRQERRIEKDMKERRLAANGVDLAMQESLMKKAKEEVDAANQVDEGKIRTIQARIWARENRAREELERVQRERWEKLWKAQQEEREKQEREAAEALRKRQAEQRVAEQKRREEELKRRQKIIDEQTARYRDHYTGFNATAGSTSSTCRHEGWWAKVQGRRACPRCADVWTYLLECPGCQMNACPKCQASIRPRQPRNGARTFHRPPPRVRTPSPDYGYSSYGYDYD